jgi:uroporphyrinogen decarboxylase
MNSRERFLATIKGGTPDRPPVFANFTPQVAEKMSEAVGIPYVPPFDSLLSTRNSHTEVLLKLGNDAVGIAANAPNNARTVTDKNGIITNEWGMQFKNKGLYNEFIGYPLDQAETAQDIENYNFPAPYGEGRFDDAKAAVAKYKGEFGIIADLETSIFETAWYLTGLEKFMMDLMMVPEYLEPLLDKITDINTKIGVELIKIGADLVWCGDDFGSQSGLMIDLDTWRRFFKPRIKKMFDAFRAVNPDIKIAWHSCGAVRDLIPEFIELGLDFMNPIQPMATNMEPQSLKDEFGDDIGFFGGICVQDLLPNKSPEEIKEEVKRRVTILGKNGGYILAPAHNVQDDTSVENVSAFFEAVTEL